MGKGRSKRLRRKRRQRKNDEAVAATAAADHAADKAAARPSPPRTCGTCRYWTANASVNSPPEIDNGGERLSSEGHCRYLYSTGNPMPLLSIAEAEQNPSLSEDHNCHVGEFWENDYTFGTRLVWAPITKPMEPPGNNVVRKFQKKYRGWEPQTFEYEKK